MGDTEIQHQRHPVRLIRKVSHELDVPTMMIPTLNDMLCFYSMCGEEKVSDLINHPVVCHFGTRFPATESRERFLRNHWDLDAHGGGKECLSKTSSPGFVSISHLRPDYRILNGIHYTML